MDTTHESRRVTRRELLRSSTAVAGSTLIAGFMRGTPLGAAGAWLAGSQQAGGATQTDALTATRAQLGAAPIETVKLGDGLVMLAGPGGNIVVLSGPDGKIAVDTFVLPAWPALKKTLDGLGSSPIKLVIDSHWHFDHTDNNANFRQAGAGILAHANTTTRLSETHELLGMRFEPAPAEARPTQTFTDSHKLQANGEAIELGYIQPAHTDTDIYIRFTKANVLHLGDTYFAGMYPSSMRARAARSAG